MRKLLVVVLLLAQAYISLAETGNRYLSYFSPQIIDYCNTAQTSYLSNEEKEVILWTNLVRQDPQNFSRLLIQYIKDTRIFPLTDPYVQSLLSDLKKSPVLQPLGITDLLNQNARQHALYSQQTKRMGHDNFDKRADIALHQQYSSYGENCAYGSTDALNAVISLLIDKGVPDLGHRKIILSNRYSHMGVAVRPFYNDREKVVIQQFGKTEIPSLTAPVPVQQVSVQKSVPAAPAAVAPARKVYMDKERQMLVDTSKYYTWEEYQAYLEYARKIKAQQNKR